MIFYTAVSSLFALILVTFVLYVTKWIKLKIYQFKKLKKLPGPPQKGFLIGNMGYLGRTRDVIFQRLRQASKDFYPIYNIHALHKMSANILRPEDCELILSNPIHNEKGDIYNLVHNWLNDGLLTSSGTKWQSRRKILTPAFHFSILQQFVQTFNEKGEKLVEMLKEECGKPYVQVKSVITQFTLNTIAETAMGTKFDLQKKSDTDYKEAIREMDEIMFYKMLRPWFSLKFINLFNPLYLKERKVLNVLHNFTKGVIRNREKTFTHIEIPTEHEVYKGKKRLAMLDLLLSAKTEGNIDDEGIQEEVDTFTFEGHDTTAAALSFILMLISCNEDVQENIVHEMVQILGDLAKKPTYTDLQNLKYMERCVKETLRLYPSVYFISRKLGEDLETHTGYFLPKETNVLIHIYDIHRDPEIYPDPEKFDPDRFLPENSQNRHPFAYIPFSAGSRNCIGQKFAMLELKAALCAILGNFFLEEVDNPESIVLVAHIILRTKEDIKVRLRPRRREDKR